MLWKGDGKAPKRPRSDRPGEILRLLSRARRNAALYGAAHPFIMETFSDLQQLLQEALSRRPSIKLFIHEDTFFVENTVLLEDSLQLYPLLIAFEEREINIIQLDAGVEPWELKHLIEILNLAPKEVRQLGGAGAYLAERKVQHIKLGSAAGVGVEKAGLEWTTGLRDAEDSQTSDAGIQAPPGQTRNVKVDPHDAYRAGLRVMDEMTYQASRNLPLSLRKARVVVNSFIDILAEDNTALPAVAILKNYDEDTYHHSVSVSILSILIGSQLNLDRKLLITLGLAGLLHDIGKVRVPRELLAKPATLTPEEEKIVRRHTMYGAHVLRDLPGLSRLAMVVAFEHHTNYDLSGYPQVTRKEMPHLLTRIVHVADVFDAATSSRRAYRRPMLQDQVLKVILDGAGTIFDPVVAKLALLVLGTLSREITGRTSRSHGQGTSASRHDSVS